MNRKNSQYNMNEIKNKKRKHFSSRNTSRNKVIFTFLVIAFMLLGLIYKLGHIQFVEAKEGEYHKLATIQQASRFDEVIAANRGLISDRNGEILAISNTVYDVILDITNIFHDSLANNRDAYIEKNINVLSEVLQVEKDEIAQYYEIDSETGQPKYIDYMYLKIASKIPYDDYKKIEEANLVSVYTIENTKRTYPKNNVASQIVGFMLGDHSSDYYGLENYYNSYLVGSNGRKFSTLNENGESYTDLVEPINGNKLQTTLDLNIQREAENIVFEYGEEYGAKNAALIVMKAKTSEVLTMAQYPTFNPNKPGSYDYFNKSDFSEKYEALSSTEGKEEEAFEMLMSVWNNFVINSTFEPGSTYKPSVIAAALEEEVISVDDHYFCDGNIQVLDRTINCWNIVGHGTQTPIQILENSCNVGMIQIAEQMGPELFLKYQSSFGFGEISGIDLVGEVSAKNLMFNLDNLNPVELATSSMGQGFNSTALQSINAFASIINGGNLMKPYVVSEVVDKDGKIVAKNEPTLIRKTISKETSDILRQGMQNVVDIGTGKNAAIPGYTIGGKTGTAEQGNRSLELETVSFIGYFPVENPEYIVMSVLHLPEVDVSGGGQAAPMVRDLMQYIIDYHSISPSKTVDNVLYNSNSNQKITPNLLGLDVDDAVNQLINLGIDFQVVDSGQYVLRTFPEGNTILDKNSKVLIYSSDDFEKDTVDDAFEAETEVTSINNEDNITANIDENKRDINIEVEKYIDTKDLVTVPDVYSMELNKAIDSLDFLEFNYKIFVLIEDEEVLLEKDGTEIYSKENEKEIIETINYNNYVVIRQSHKSNINTPKGSTIKLIVEKTSN